jgi:hypothetical protein
MSRPKIILPPPPVDTRTKDMSARQKPSSPPARAVNISKLARDHQVSRETIRKLRENGISLADDKAVAAGLACSRAKSTAPAPSPTDGGESFAEAKRRRAVADANRAEVIASRESGAVIAVADVEALMVEIGATMRSRLLSMRSDLVVELEGRSGAQIYAALDKRITALLEGIHRNSPIPKP